MNDDIAARLAAPFDPQIVSWRVGSTNQDKTRGMALAFVDARDVMRRLDEVCGIDGWQDEYPWSDGKRVVCRIGILFADGQWIWKADGAGDTDYEGEKGALSDAFKRAAVKFGVGRYLYDTDSPWVQIEQRGKSFIIPDAEKAKLANLLRRQFPAAPQHQERNATNGAGAGAAVEPLTPVEAAAHPNMRERLVLDARKARERVIAAMGVATEEKLIDEILKLDGDHGDDLRLIKDVHEPAFKSLLMTGESFKAQMRGATG